MNRDEVIAKALEFSSDPSARQLEDQARKQINEFVERFPFRAKPELIRSLSPDEVFSWESADGFFNWIAQRTGKVGAVFECEEPAFQEAARRIDFLKVLLTVLVSDKKSVSFKIDQNWGIIPGLGGEKQVVKKMLSLYYPDGVIPVFRNSDLEAFASALGMNYRNAALQRYRKDYTMLTAGQRFELLNAMLLEFRKASLGTMSGVMFSLFLYSHFMGVNPERQGNVQSTVVENTGSSLGERIAEAEELVAQNKELEGLLEEERMRVEELQSALKSREEEIERLKQELREKELAVSKQQSAVQEPEEKGREQMWISRVALLQKQLEEMQEQLRLAQNGAAKTQHNEIEFMEGKIGTFRISSSSQNDSDREGTGIARLDDLLNGGIPRGSQVVIYGPSFIGKEIAMNYFAAQGLTEGRHLVWITTDRPVDEIREEMAQIMPEFQECEEKGLVYYIDAYSGMVGDEGNLKNAAYLHEDSNVEMISTLTDEYISSIGEDAVKKGCRVVFRSISGLSTSNDKKDIFAMLKQFVSRRRRDGSTCLYSVEKGIMSEQDLLAIDSLMDGIMEFSTDGKNNFISVKGVCETQSRDKIQYQLSGNSIEIGSFSLGRIK